MSDRTATPTPPLDGVRVLDLTRVLAGPVSGRILAELGADVVKVEPSEPDISRFVAPRRDRGMSGLYTLANVGKRNLCVDVRRPEGLEIVMGLVRWADCALENFRPGVMDALGLAWETLHRENPKLVLLSINGYGEKSPWRERRSFAPIVHAQSGVIQYHAEWTGSPITQLADNQADISGSLHGAIGLLAALHAAQRSGVGRRVEVPLFDALLSTYSETPFAMLDEPVHRDECPLYDAGPLGYIAVAGPPQNAWARLRDTYGLEDPAPGPVAVALKAQRRQAVMEEWMAEHADLESLIDRIEAAGLAAGRVENLREVLLGPVGRQQGLLTEVDDHRGGTRPLVRMPYRFDGERCPPPAAAPRQGQHSREILADVLELPEDRIDALVAAGVVLADPDAD